MKRKEREEQRRAGEKERIEVNDLGDGRAG